MSNIKISELYLVDANSTVDLKGNEPNDVTGGIVDGCIPDPYPFPLPYLFPPYLDPEPFPMPGGGYGYD